MGEGEWAAVNHGGRGHRGGKTLHLAVDRGGVIVAHALTEPTVDAATIGIDLIETVDDEIARVTADAAYETVAFYAAAEMRDATVVVPPSKTARVSRRRPRSRARDRTITDVRTLGRRWCADAGRPTRFKPSSPSPTDAVRDGSAKLGHPVQNVTREHGLTPLPR